MRPFVDVAVRVVRRDREVDDARPPARPSSCGRPLGRRCAAVESRTSASNLASCRPQSKIGPTVRVRLSSKKPGTRPAPDPVEHLAGLLALGGRRHHRAEEGDVADVDDRGADVVADRVHARRGARRAARRRCRRSHRRSASSGGRPTSTSAASTVSRLEPLLPRWIAGAERGVEGARAAPGRTAPRRPARPAPGPSRCPAWPGSPRTGRGRRSARTGSSRGRPS